MQTFSRFISRLSTRSRRLAGTVLLGAVLLGSSGCDILIEFVPPEPELRITDASYGTNFRDRDNNSIICDNYTTRLTYRFEYQGELRSWRSFIRGENTGNVRGERDFALTDDRRDRYGSDYVEVTYDIPPERAPLSLDAGLSPESIVVVPNPTILGYSRLMLTVRGDDEHYDYESDPIPVVSVCNL
ncbi:MAG: hypothetical protein U5L04_02055 [Trueperaceae bacterium]|nr:hypothetical protein [Trueperaceae bacterium]